MDGIFFLVLNRKYTYLFICPIYKKIIVKREERAYPARFVFVATTK